MRDDEMNIAMAVIAFIVFVVFLGILIFHVPRIDLVSVVTITVFLAAWDLYSTFRSRKG
jgi:hypothetical protein